MILVAVLGSVFVGAVVWLLWAEVTGSPTRRIAKMTASSGFVLIAVVAGAAETAVGWAILTGLILSWLGDLALTYPSARSFVTGLTLFLAAHLAFAFGFLIRGVEPVVLGIGAVAMAAFAGQVWRRLSPHVPGPLRAPVVAYLIVISAMVAIAAGTTAAEPGLGILAGAVAFAVSDLAVARERFVAPGVGNRLWGLPLYYLAQALFAVCAS